MPSKEGIMEYPTPYIEQKGDIYMHLFAIRLGEVDSVIANIDGSVLMINDELVDGGKCKIKGVKARRGNRKGFISWEEFVSICASGTLSEVVLHKGKPNATVVCDNYVNKNKIKKIDLAIGHPA